MAKTTDRTQWFREARFGMFIHWGLYAIPARGEWVRSHERISNEKYDAAYFTEFNPTRYDPRTWARLAKAAGQKYAVITAKHHDGFCLFDSRHTDYKATNTPIGRDLLREWAEAFRAEGLKVGFYYSLIDWHHPDYPKFGDKFHPMRDNAEYQGRSYNLPRYVDYLHAQVEELVTGYGRVDLMWFDFSYVQPDTFEQPGLAMSGDTWRAEELVKMIRKHQPHIIFDNRLSAGHEDPKNRSALGDILTPEQFIPQEGLLNADGTPATWEACITMNGNWGYARDDKNFKTPAQIVQMLVECVSKGGNLLLNVGPTAMGEIQLEFVRDLGAVGVWMARNGESIYGCGRAAMAKPEWGRYTLSADGKILYAHVLQRPVGPVPVAGLAGRIKKARLLADGSEVSLSTPWMVAHNQADCFINLPGAGLGEELDTVVALYLG